MNRWQNNEEINIFRKYLQIPTVHPNIDYEPAVQFIRNQAEDLKLPLKIYYPADKLNPVVVLTWIGKEPDLPSILLSSHMDVVPVFPEMWSRPPFAAEIDENGNIYARGSQDMKCVAMQYLAAIGALKKEGAVFKRTIHICFTPDEEMGGARGMKQFAKTDDFKRLNVGYGLDEGIASVTDEFLIFYGERSVWRVHFHISGTSGHGSILHSNTVGEKLHYIVNKMMTLRAQEVQNLKDNPNLALGDVTTINLTRVAGGVQTNVVPPKMSVGFDIRLANTIDHGAFEKQINEWCKEAGGGIEIEYEAKRPYVKPTKTDETNPFWVAIKRATDELNLKLKKAIFPAATDSRYVRMAGIPVFGFSPMNNTPVLLHDHDEFLNADVYLRGIEIYKKIIPSIANL